MKEKKSNYLCIFAFAKQKLNKNYWGATGVLLFQI